MSAPNPTERDAYTVPEVAARLGVTARHIYRLVETGEIPCIRLGRRVVIPTPVYRELIGQAP